jgi:hypothetical protein
MNVALTILMKKNIFLSICRSEKAFGLTTPPSRPARQKPQKNNNIYEK